MSAKTGLRELMRALIRTRSVEQSDSLKGYGVWRMAYGVWRMG
jgi:hypothetical protein